MSGVEVEKNSTSEKTPTTLQSPVVDNGSSRKTFHYSKLPEETLSLSIHKLDGSSFNVEVLKSSTVEDLKLGVQNVFDHLPNGPDKISWVHVWGHFCLSYGDQKLIQDTDLIVNYGIKDSDQLHFIRHVSSCTNSKKIPKNKETVPRDHSYQLLVVEVEDDYEVLKEGSCVHLWSSCSNLSSFKGTATFKNRGCRSSVCVIL